MITKEAIWIAIGLSGQLMFSMRFLIQWIKSELNKESVIPISFWYFSIFGGVTLLAYAIYRQDPVFILGQLLGVIVYSRNLRLICITKQKKNSQNTPVATDEA
tara:strand:- start:255 stop:563 length:309 start_codon:yes stop_codon:yes gene_type:complete